MVFSNDSIISNLQNLYATKVRFTNPKDILPVIIAQQNIISSIDISTHKKFSFMLYEISENFSKENLDLMDMIGNLNKTQEKVLIDSIETELQQILEILIKLKKNFSNQKNIVEQTRHNLVLPNEYTILLSEENDLLKILANLFKADDILEKKFLENIRAVEKIKSKDWFIKIIKKFSKTFILGKYKLIVTGLENIPSSGPVVIAPRHYNGDVDGGLMLSIIPRRLFIMMGVDWLTQHNNAYIKINSIAMPAFGGLLFNRVDAPTKVDIPDATVKSAMQKMIDALKLNQAVLLFPEAWPNIDTHYTPKKIDDGIIPLRDGVFFAVDIAQRNTSKTIPIIPVGLIYSKDTNVINVNFGESLYYEGNSKTRDYDKFSEKLRIEISKLSGLE